MYYFVEEDTVQDIKCYCTKSDPKLTDEKLYTVFCKSV